MRALDANQIQWEPPYFLPMNARVPISKWVLFLMIFQTVFFFGMLLIAQPEDPIFLGGLLFFILLNIKGYFAYFSGIKIKITHDTVMYNTNHFPRIKMFTAPLSEYSRLIQYETTTDKTPLYCISLEHESDPYKDFRLYASYDQYQRKEAYEKFQRLFNFDSQQKRAAG